MFGTEPRPPKGFPQFSAIMMTSSLLNYNIVNRPSQKMKNSYPIQSRVSYCAFGDAVWFLLRDADMHSAYLLRQRGWLSVAGCPSDAGIVSKRLNLSLKLFRPSGSPIILVSSDPCADTQFQGEPLQRGR